MDWTPDEKRALLQALYQYGTSDIKKLQAVVPYRLPYQIQRFIRNYKVLAKGSLNERKRKPEEKLEEWRCCLKDKNHVTNSRLLKEDLISRVMKYIDYFEKDKLPDEFASCNEYLVTLLKGKVPKPTTETCSKVLYQCTRKLANEIKQNDNAEVIQVLTDISVKNENPEEEEEEKNEFKAVFTNHMDLYLMDNSTNPFEIPLNLLKE